MEIIIIGSFGDDLVQDFSQALQPDGLRNELVHLVPPSLLNELLLAVARASYYHRLGHASIEVGFPYFI